MFSKSLRRQDEGNNGWAKTGAQTVLPPTGGKVKCGLDADLEVGRKASLLLIPSFSQNENHQLMRARKGHLFVP